MPESQRRALDLGVTAARDAVATLAGGGEVATGRILFGDLHVHTTYSLDAFVYSLPVFGGEGAHPPADACDFARYCASLDFFALTDHAESLTPQRWREEKDTIRACDARAGDPADPDLVTFLGFEWTQVGATPETHDGHRNVIFRGLADPELPPRPIGAKSGSTPLERQLEFTRSLQRLDPLHWRRYSDFVWVLEHVSGVAPCPAALDSHALPPDCAENTASVEVLLEKLRRLGLDSIVIPHGTTWGSYTPLGYSLETQLTVQKYDPSRERLIELFSGHGSSEPYRPFRDSVLDADGREVCTPPTGDYLPCCWQAGEIMRSRCGDLPAAECEVRVEQARRLALEAGTAAELVFLDATPEEWLDCGQCRDCFKPTFGPRPQASVQYGLALSSPDEVDAQGRPLRFRWGFVSSSDNHAARAGAGYKEFGRHGMTDGMGVRSAFYYDRGFEERVEAQKDPQRPRRTRPSAGGLTGSERLSSFLYPGGLVAVHAEARTRDAVWDALGRRQVYGTSGPRILLWFDLLNGPAGRAPMGSEVEMAETPRFEVRAVGSLVEQPGCPTASLQGLSAERLEYLCRGECHNPGDARHPIVAIEIVRIRPRHEAGEDPGAGIEDPWRRFECPPDPRGCVVSFEDADPATSRRDVVYYARAVQEETPAVNGANLRTEFDAEGRPLRITPCYGHSKTPFEDDCLAPVQERAWSSPVYVDRPRRE